jgi:hypothetical protein
VTLALLLDVAAGGLLLGGLYALIAVGLNLQYGLMRVLNVAHGEYLMVGGAITYVLHVYAGVNPLVSLLVSGPVACAAGVGVHRALYRRLLRQEMRREELEANSLLISFGLLLPRDTAWRPHIPGLDIPAVAGWHARQLRVVQCFRRPGRGRSGCYTVRCRSVRVVTPFQRLRVRERNAETAGQA